MTAAAISVRGLEKSYRGLHVLQGVDFEVERGSVFALLGSNGSGKTTVVRILSTLSRADAGTASIVGFDVDAQASRVRESISLTGQFTAVDGVLTGKENLLLVAKLRHLTDPEKIADEMLARFRLSEVGDRAAATYSGGMRRRLDIAMSLIGDPAVVFLDEPTTGLDPDARIEVWQAIKTLAGGGTTVMLTTQYLEEVEWLADRIAILHRGALSSTAPSTNSSGFSGRRKSSTSRSSRRSRKCFSQSWELAAATAAKGTGDERTRHQRYRRTHRPLAAPYPAQPRHHHHHGAHAHRDDAAVRLRPRGSGRPRRRGRQ